MADTSWDHSQSAFQECLSPSCRVRAEGVIAAGDRVVCILTGHQLKDPASTVAYHSSRPGAIDELLVSRGVEAVRFSNQPSAVAAGLDDLLDLIRQR